MARSRKKTITFVGRFWQGWKRVAKRVGQFQARIVMAIFYFTIFTPFALAIRWGRDPLVIKPGACGGWQPVSPPEGSSLDQARKQF
jgi:hypothetical protein